MDPERRTEKRSRFAGTRFDYPPELLAELKTLFQDEQARRLPEARPPRLDLRRRYSTRDKRLAIRRTDSRAAPKLPLPTWINHLPVWLNRRPRLKAQRMVALPNLTDRQRDCLREFANFRTHKEIARLLGISDSMVEKHLRQAREKLGVDSTAEAARLYLIHEGEALPQGGFTHLTAGDGSGEKAVVAHELSKSQPFEIVRDASPGAADLDHPLTVLQTLSLIGRLVIGSIIGLTLLIACAEGLKAVLI